MLVLLSRAAVADFAALSAEAASGRPQDRHRRLSRGTGCRERSPFVAPPACSSPPHRAGSLTSALEAIGALVLEDLSLIARGLPPVSCRRAERETVRSLRSKPIEAS